MNNYLIDTHCHIHDPEFNAKYQQTPEQIVTESKKKGVRKLICVGTSMQSSQLAVDFANKNSDVFASLALHPHEVADYSSDELKRQMKQLDTFIAKDKSKKVKSSIVAIGECGLDYFYHNNKETHSKQAYLLRQHLLLAKKYDLPVIFHIRSNKNDKTTPTQAFIELQNILQDFQHIRGVVHSFSAGLSELEMVTSAGLYVGLNGIITFTKEERQIEAVKKVPLERTVLETDAPFLTPTPFRGKMCKPEHVSVTAKFLSELRCESPEKVASVTTKNARQLFKI